MARRIGDALWRRRIGGRLGGGKVTTGGIDWLLKLDFPTAAGPPLSSPYNEDSTGGVGSLTLVQLDGQFSIVGGKLLFPAQATPASNDQYIASVDSWPRTAGLMLLGQITLNTDNKILNAFGFATNPADITTRVDVITWQDSTRRLILLDTSPTPAITLYTGTSGWTVGETYWAAVILRSAGAFFYIWGGQWGATPILHYIFDGNTASPLYVYIHNYNQDGAIDTLRVTQLPTTNAARFPAPLVSDDGSGAAGAIGSSNGLVEPSATDTPGAGAGYAFSNAGATWTRDGAGALVNTPTPGAELVTNGSFTAWTADNPDGWTVGSEAAGYYITENPAGQAEFVSDGTTMQMYQSILTTGVWYATSVEVTARTGGSVTQIWGATNKYTHNSVTTTTLTSLNTSSGTFILRCTVAGSDITLDNISVKALVLSELMTLIDRNVSTCILRAPLTITGNYQAGLVARADSASNPQSYILAYLDKTDSKIYAVKSVSGVVTQLGATAVTVSAGAKLVLRVLSDNTVWIGYKNAFVASYTVSDAAIIGNTLHGPFSTGPGSSISSYEFFPPHAIDLDDYTV